MANFTVNHLPIYEDGTGGAIIDSGVDGKALRFPVTVAVGPQIFYVSPTGVDAPGRGTVIGSPLKTLNYTYNTALQSYDLKGLPVTIVLDSSAGPYTENFTAQGRLCGQANDTDVKFVGSPGNAVIQGQFNTNGRGCSLSVQNMTFQANPGASYSSPNGALLTIGNNTSLFVLSGVIIGDNPGDLDFQPTWHAYLDIAGTYTIAKTNNVKLFTCTSGSAVLNVNSTSGLQVGDTLSHVPNAVPPLGVIAYTAIPPFAKIVSINTGASQVTIDRNAISTQAVAQNGAFTRTSVNHIQADQRAEVFYGQSAGIGALIDNVAAYSGGFVSADLATYVSGETAIFSQDNVSTGIVGQVNGPSFIIFNGAVFDAGGAALTRWPGSVISITGTLTSGNVVISGLSAADQAQITNYMNTFPNNFGLMITGTGLKSGAKIAAIGSLSGSNLTMTLTANSSATVTLTLGGFVYNYGIHQQNAPPVTD